MSAQKGVRKEQVLLYVVEKLRGCTLDVSLHILISIAHYFCFTKRTKGLAYQIFLYGFNARFGLFDIIFLASDTYHITLTVLAW